MVVKYHLDFYNMQIQKNTQIKDHENNISVIFEKKEKKISNKDLTHITSDTGESRHYTPAAQEWHNSIYSYNVNYTKTLPVADTNLMRLLKTYFNLEMNHKILKTKRMATRYKRLTTKKVYIGKGDLKHTSSKTIITFYVYNTPKMSLSRAVYLTKKALFFPKKRLQKYVNKDINNNIITRYNRPLNLKEFINLPEHNYKAYIDYVIPYIDINNMYLTNLELQRNILIKLVNLDLISEKDKNITMLNLYEDVSFFNNTNYATYMENTEEYYLKNLKRFRYLLGFNKMKFSQPFISKLISLVQDIYNKNVEFNIVNLKKMHLSSDIYTQAVALKLKNRENRLYKVLKSSLRKVKLPEISRIAEKSHNINKDELLINLIRNKNIRSMFTLNNGNDSLNSLLLNFFPAANNLKIKHVKNTFLKEEDISLKNYILKALKHLDMRGIRVEAKGRITRRFTASRSVFKMKWKGGLKNVDSSFKGLSTIMLRGHAKSNVQYSFVSSKNRNGAYGVKGWISSK